VTDSGRRREKNIPGSTPAQQARFAAGLDALQGAEPLILAVSGGPDSIALLLLAAAVRRRDTIIAATVDHHLRPAAAEEARFVHQVCARIGVHHRTLDVKVEDKEGVGVQASAREARYRALVWYAKRKEATAIATAHHIDDQAETVLMRLGRGAGVSGLAGVRERRPLKDGIDLIRPLLGWRRNELAAIVASARIEAVDDPSNHDSRYDRTRVRDMLALGWPDPARLAAVSRHMRDADDALDWTAKSLFAERFRKAGEGAELDTQGLPREYIRRLMILAMAAQSTEGGAPRGDELGRLMDRLEGGHVSTLGQLQITPGAVWRFATVAPHRAG
jgi:tRNA(Ile)-lysidine synthase